MTEPATAITNIGMRIASPCSATKNFKPDEAAASEPIPINRRSPLIAMTAAHALCSKIKKKLERPMSQDFRETLS
jgi:hypothetical protein